MSKPLISLRFGAFADDIRDQLRDQGIRVTTATASVWQRAADSLSFVKAWNFVPERIAIAGYQKLGKRIEKHLLEIGKIRRAVERTGSPE